MILGNLATVLPLFYWPNIAYCSLLLGHANIQIEQHEHFIKQTYRSRACVLSSSGKQNLIIPLVKGAHEQQPYRDARISYDQNWQRQHLYTLKTCYQNSPYFEFYMPDMMVFYEQKWTFLFDYNWALLEFLLPLLQCVTHIEFTSEWMGSTDSATAENYCQSIHPKKKSTQTVKKYVQVFNDRLAFCPNLSILDMLFNCGRDSCLLLTV